MTNHTCDRCGAPCARSGAKVALEIQVAGWKGDGSVEPPREETLYVATAINQPYRDGDEPDLCVSCKVDVLRGVIAQLEGPKVAPGTSDGRD
jgi:hypothetical protein